MATRHSYKGRLEVQSDGVSGAAGYNPVNLIGSATLTSSRTSTIVPQRGTEIKTTMSGQAEVEVTAALTWDDADPQIALIEAAHWNNTHLGIKFLDQASGTGFTADMLVDGWTLEQGDDGVQIANVTFKPTFVDTNPSWA